MHVPHFLACCKICSACYSLFTNKWGKDEPGCSSRIGLLSPRFTVQGHSRITRTDSEHHEALVPVAPGAQVLNLLLQELIIIVEPEW